MSRPSGKELSRGDRLPRYNQAIAMLPRGFFLLLLIFLLGGCAAGHTVSGHSPAILQQSYEQFDLQIRWDVSAGSSGMRIDGLVRNVWSAQLEELELHVDVLDSSGNSVARTAGLVSRKLEAGESAPFILTVPGRFGSGSKLLFTYRYIPGGGDTDLWMQSFESNIPEN